MIIVRFMEVSLGYARIQVNTLRRVNDDKTGSRSSIRLPGIKLCRAAKLIGLGLRSVGALSDNLNRSSEEAVEFGNPPGRQIKGRIAIPRI